MSAEGDHEQEEAPPLGQQRRDNCLNDQHQTGKGTDMGHQPSVPSVTKILRLGEEPAPRRIAYDIHPSLIRYDGKFYTVAMTAAEARQTASILLAMAEDVDTIDGKLERP
jgi:hypothetical protein